MPGTIESVNVGVPRTMDWAGRRVTTAIWKSPLAGPVHVGRLDLAGDEQADLRVHGGPDKAVYAYAAEDYDWWSAELGHPVGPGTFGDNLTVRALDLAAAVVGQQWTVGSAVLAVAQPREPCFKLGIRMGDAGFVDRFDEARRLGVYLRVLQEGTVEAGDTVLLGPAPAHGLTTLALAAARGDVPADQLRRIADTADVPEGWRTWAQRRLDRDER